CQKGGAIRNHPMGRDNRRDSDGRHRSAVRTFLDCDTGSGGADRYWNSVCRCAWVFSPEIEAVVLTPAEDKKSNAGRKPIDVIVMFRMLVLQSLYNLSDEQVEYQVSDRMSFTRFLRLGIEDCIPDGTTLWLFREALGKAGLIEKLFKRFSRHLEAKGYIARGGQMVDATIVPVPKQRNSREENEAVKAGKTPGAWKKDQSKNRPKEQ